MSIVLESIFTHAVKMVKSIACFNCGETRLEIISILVDYKKYQVRQSVYCSKCQSEEVIVFDFKKKITFTIY
jgi:hypothetical protein